jgi:hypothetical protein
VAREQLKEIYEEDFVETAVEEFRAEETLSGGNVNIFNIASLHRTDIYSTTRI